MNKNNALEFDIIKNMLAETAFTQYAKDKFLALTPSLSVDECVARMRETTDAKEILTTFGSPSFSSTAELDKILVTAEKDGMLVPEQLGAVMIFLVSCRRMKLYLKKAEVTGLELSFYGNSIYELTSLYDELYRTIRNNIVDDSASPALKNIRRKIISSSESIKGKLDAILKGKKEYFSDGYVTMKAGRYVLPVKKEYRSQVSGTVVEISNSGGTYFVEPTAVQKIQNDIALLRVEEDSEIRKILYTLTSFVADSAAEIRTNKECIETLDFIFAKAKMSVSMDALPPALTSDRKIVIKKGRHPLIDKRICVPLDFEIGEGISGIIITGPNTGGKTVALKTVGLMSIMAQCGLHLPTSEGSSFCLHDQILCDIGDGQSITENLSTFSSHITNIISILQNATHESLVMLDELGSGTDPMEGMGLAVSILEELISLKCLFIATTHYPEIKEYAEKTDRVLNAKMEFDKETLMPLYRLRIGEAGESCAFHIARKLGFPERMLRRAYNEAYRQTSKTQKTPPSDMIFADEIATAAHNMQPSKIKQAAVKEVTEKRSEKFNIGDSVTVYPKRELGIVYKKTDEKGMIGVQIKKEKTLINHKRLKLLVPADQLYPDDYDFSIIFDTVANRKARHKMGKYHSEGLEINIDE
jgi:Mismatch repair ATPase (MutS family)